MAGAPKGNQNAAKGRKWAVAIEREIARLEGGDLEAGLARLAKSLVRQAEAGEQWALKEVGDRTDGKAAQAILHSGAIEGDPLRASIELIRPGEDPVP
jgi:hypothetical protein